MKVYEKRLTRCCAEDWEGGTLRKLKIDGDRLVLDTDGVVAGAVLLPAADSRSSGFMWDRVTLGAYLPEGSSVTVYAFASDDEDCDEIRALRRVLADESRSYSDIITAVRDFMDEPVSDGTDFLAERKGRYLWLLIFMFRTGNEGPYIQSVTYRMQGDRMTDYLPGIYSGDDVTRRFLSIFNSIYTDMDLQIDNIPRMIDLEKSSEEMLRYLAGWLEIEDSTVSPEVLRKRMMTAAAEYELMYTPAGVRWNIKRLTGAEPLILEYADVDPNAADCPDPELFRHFFGEDPYRFFVFLGNGAFDNRDRIAKFQDAMRQMIPAGMTMALITTGSVKDPGSMDPTDKKAIAELIRSVSKEDTVFDTGMTVGGEYLE